jgi:hypothetical protein
MQAIKKAAAQAASATSQLFKSPEDVEGGGRDSRLASLSAAKRRSVESILQATGQASGTPDPEWDARKVRARR